MHLNLVSSEHSKRVALKTVFDKFDKKTDAKKYIGFYEDRLNSISI